MLGAPVAGVAATLAITGSATLRTLTKGTVHLDAAAWTARATTSSAVAQPRTRSRPRVTADEPANGLISTIAHLPDLGAIAIQASVKGPRDAVWRHKLASPRAN